MKIKNNVLLIFDFDHTITNGHMHNAFSRLRKSDFNPTEENAVTDNDIRNFLGSTGGVKNEERLKSTLQSALSGGIEVNIASYTGYPNAVKKVAEYYLGLSEKQTGSISVFGGFPGDYDSQLQELDVREQQSQVGKNLHICEAIVNYKNNHNGRLPKTVMLVDDSVGNIKRINEFVESMSKRKGWLKENGLSVEDINNIKFEGVQVPKEDKNVGYLERVQEFVNANLVQEPIYENLREEESLYATANKSTISLKEEMKGIRLLLNEDGVRSKKAIHNVQDAFKKQVMEAIKKQGYSVSSEERESGITVEGSKPIDVQQIMQDNFSQFTKLHDKALNDNKNENLRKKEPIYQNTEELLSSLPQKRKSSDGMVADSENKTQDIKDMSSSETQANPTRSKRHAMMLDPQQIEPIHQNAEEPPLGKKYTHTETISLAQEFKAIKAFFKDCAQKVIDAICNLFRREVATKIEGQGYNVSSKQGSSEITVKGSKPIDASRINKDIIVESLAQIIEKKEKIKDLNNNYKGDQLGREISKLLNAGSQKENINSNYNDGEPIFQTREEASNYPPQKKDINSNSVRGNYNDGESIFQTVQEPRNYHRQKKGIDSNPVSKKPLVPPVPTKNYTERVIQSRNIEGIGRNK
ncbi:MULTISPECIES: hypothetical protein [Wolbachia]|uniref:hypothetical protein n=1 Tax=Wolbachia TaxID=953 RepID=UPI002174EBC0|nr:MULTISPECIES: hypothetical protein [Wolbachia]MDE5059116.1 hypothetical protein [Wolbachia endosymbiont of Drosophila baimaii]